MCNYIETRTRIEQQFMTIISRNLHFHLFWGGLKHTHTNIYIYMDIYVYMDIYIYLNYSYIYVDIYHIYIYIWVCWDVLGIVPGREQNRATRRSANTAGIANGTTPMNQLLLIFQTFRFLLGFIWFDPVNALQSTCSFHVSEMCHGGSWLLLLWDFCLIYNL